MANNASRFGTLVAGAGLLATGFVAHLAVGSFGTTGNVVTDATQNSRPAQIYYVSNTSSGAYTQYQEATLTASGSRALTADLQILPKTGSASVVDTWDVSCDTIGKSTSGSIAIHGFVKQGITTGTVGRNFIGISSGSTVRSGTGFQLKKVPYGQYVSFIGNSSGGMAYLNGSCKLKVWSHDKFGR